MDIQILTDADISYAQGLERFSDHKELYEKYLKRFPQDPEFAALAAAMDAENYAEAFTHAHTLKGLAGNLSVNGFYSAVRDLVEKLRNGADIPGAVASFPAVRDSYNSAVAAINRYFV